MVDAASRLTHLPDRKFLSHFRTNFQKSKPWRLITLPSAYRRHLTTMINNKESPIFYLQPCSRSKPQPGANGSASAAVWKSRLVLKALNNQFLSSRFLPCVSVMAFCTRKGKSSISDWLSNTSDRLVKSLHQWGPTPPATTVSGNSTFGWDASLSPIRRRVLLQQ